MTRQGHRLGKMVARCALGFALATGCWSASVQPARSQVGNAEPCGRSDRFTIAVHGGAVWGQRSHDRQLAFVAQLLPWLRARLEAGARALDMVQTAVVEMENSGLFNAGRGARANQAGDIELDAAIMDGTTLRAGGVAGVSLVKNPVAAARMIMERSPHVLMVGGGAEEFLRSSGMVLTEAAYFLNSAFNMEDVPLPEDLKVDAPSDDMPSGLRGYLGMWSGLWAGAVHQVVVVESIDESGGQLVLAQGSKEEWEIAEGTWERVQFRIVEGEIRFERRKADGSLRAKVRYRLNEDGMLATSYELSGGTVNGTLQKRSGPSDKGDGGTVGAVALDRCGRLAAAVSTGGFGSKMPGRVGDSPIVGAGLYAKDGVAAVSATGHGEYFLRLVVAHKIIVLMEETRLSLADAASRVIGRELSDLGGKGGIIAVDAQGRVFMPFNTVGMIRGAIGHEVPMQVEVYARD